MDLQAALLVGSGVAIADMTGTVLCDVVGASMLGAAHREAAAVGAEVWVAASPGRHGWWLRCALRSVM